MSDTSKPMPDVDDPLTAPFWAATRESRLVVPQCSRCGYLWWPPEPVCPECYTAHPGWCAVEPCGTLWSYAVYHRALDPSFADDLPYAVGLVELDAGPKMYGLMTTLPGVDAIGCRARAVFDEIDADVTFVRWELEE